MKLNDILNTKIEDLNFCIVDVETTGMHSKFNRIMDIGIVKMQNGVIKEKWETLIHPKQSIPYWITDYTKLSYDHIKNEKPFEKHAQKIWDMLDNSIFVAHNVGFDYWFIYNEFQRLDIEFAAPKLCTVLLSRKLILETDKANLDALAELFDIEISARHRALPDAEATTIILNELIRRAKYTYNAKTFLELERLQRIKISKPSVNLQLQLPLT